MGVDENEFFRQATIRICGSLIIEKAMCRCLQYLQDIMPAESMYLCIFDPGRGAVRTIASATVEEGQALDILTPLPEEARAAVLKMKADPMARIINRPELEPIYQTMAKFFVKGPSSLLLVKLVRENESLGTVVLRAEGEDRFQPEHARLFGMLNGPFAIALSNSRQHQEVLKLKDLLADDNRFLNRELLLFSGDEIIGADAGLKGVMDLVRQVAPLNSPVLLLGETGVGKEVIANVIHELSTHSDGPLIKVNCGAIPETLLDSELFGHEKGAFTGAVSQKRGRFERADKGIIFLDEIGELPPAAQIRLLRVLQEKEIERVGGSVSIPVDVRVIAATHRNLGQMVANGQFREDLFFRLNVFPIPIPPLRERKGDIPALVNYYVERKSRELMRRPPPALAPGAIEVLLAYDWPGNIRELENAIERALIINHGEFLEFDLPGWARREENSPAASTEADAPLVLDEVTSRHIRKVLKLTNGKVHGPGGAAELLGMNPSTLRNRMKSLGISFGRRS